PYALHSLGGYHLEIGDFAKAVTHCQRAAALLPDEADIRYYYKQSLLAATRYPALMELLRRDEAAPFPNCITALSDQVLVLNLMNRRGEVEGVLSRVRQRMHGFDKKLVEQQVAFLQTVDQY